MTFQPPSEDEIKRLLIEAPRFYWPTFEHMPLNCFDLGSGTISFPGDISERRAKNSSIYAPFQFDIADLETCPRYDTDFDEEIWNEQSTTVRWYLGGFNWACTIDTDGYALKQGYFAVDVNITRFQNIDEVTDIREPDQLQRAIRVSLSADIKKGFFKDYDDYTTQLKTFKQTPWLIVGSYDQLGYPAYHFIAVIDHQHAIAVYATLNSCWSQGETIPKEVERKHLESMWDFLGQINLSLAEDSDRLTGSFAREAPGHAEKIEDDLNW